MSTLSNSYVKMLYECPKKFYYRAVKELTPVQQEESTALLTGKLFHLTFEHMYRKNQLLDLPEELRPAQDLIVEWLDRNGSKLLYVETPMLITVGLEKRFIIKPDFILQDSEGVWIGDLKTSKTPTRTLSNYYNIPQPWTYLRILKWVWENPEDIKGVLLLGLATTKTPTLIEERIPTTQNALVMATKYLTYAFETLSLYTTGGIWPCSFNCVNFYGATCHYLNICQSENTSAVIESHLQMKILEQRPPFEYLGPIMQVGLGPETIETKEVKICD